MSYEQEVIYQMVLGLAGDGLLRKRLAGIAIYLGPRLTANLSSDPIIKGKLERIYRRLSHNGDIDATVTNLSDVEAKAITRDIIDVLIDVSGGWQR